MALQTFKKIQVLFCFLDAFGDLGEFSDRNLGNISRTATCSWIRTSILAQTLRGIMLLIFLRKIKVVKYLNILEQ